MDTAQEFCKIRVIVCIFCELHALYPAKAKSVAGYRHKWYERT